MLENREYDKFIKWLNINYTVSEYAKKWFDYNFKYYDNLTLVELYFENNNLFKKHNKKLFLECCVFIEWVNKNLYNCNDYNIKHDYLWFDKSGELYNLEDSRKRKLKS